MSIQVSAVPRKQTSSTSGNGDRHTANFHLTVWGDHFLSYDSRDLMKEYHELEKKVQALKVKVRSILRTTSANNIAETLKLINSIQCLSFAYHFESEINELLEKIYIDLNNINNEEDLNITTLRFRLLRQQGYNISSEIFKRFKDGNGEFDKSLVEDVKGLLSLYEAAHLRVVRGEDILDEALDFTTTHLKAIVTSLSPTLAAEVDQSLMQPIRRGLLRLRAKHYMTMYLEDPSHNDVLLTFAKFDFNMLQKLHQSELSHLSRWWRDLRTELTFSRDRIVECFFWAIVECFFWASGVYYEPQYFLGRRIFSLMIALISVLDDIYDAFGTYEELVLFTKAIERWDIKMIHQLPRYMQVFYQALMDLFEEIEQKGRQYGIFYAKRAIEEQVRAYLKEAQWLKEGYTPSLEEYRQISTKSSGSKTLSITSFLGMDDVATPEAFEWADKNPKTMQASSILGRLLNDIVSPKFERERDHVVSAVECYMKEHNHQISEEEIYREFRREIENAWKDLNEACLNPVEVPMEVLTRILNLNRVMDLLYMHEDGYTNSLGATKQYIESLLIESMPL